MNEITPTSVWTSTRAKKMETIIYYTACFGAMITIIHGVLWIFLLSIAVGGISELPPLSLLIIFLSTSVLFYFKLLINNLIENEIEGPSVFEKIFLIIGCAANLFFPFLAFLGISFNKNIINSLLSFLGFLFIEGTPSLVTGLIFWRIYLIKKYKIPSETQKTEPETAPISPWATTASEKTRPNP